jgi:hypothetical protein
MSRVRYLAALGGTAGRRAPAPLLRPPQRLFPHEPPPLEPPLPLLQPADEVSPTSKQPIVGPESLAPEPPEPEAAEAVRPSRAPHPDAPRALSRAEPHVEEVLPPSSEAAPTRQREAVRVSRAPAPLEARTALRAADPALPPPRDARRKTASLEFEPVPAEPARRSPATPGPSRLRPPAVTPPEHPVAATRPAAVAAQAPGLHIGSIDVTVSPPAPAPPEPAFGAQPAPVHRPPAPFASRGASTSRWFGLAQR